MISDKDIIVFSSIDWDFNWQIHQELSSFLAKNNRVLFIENTGLRNPQIIDAHRFRTRFHNWWASFKGFKQIANNLFVFSPLILPFPHSKIAGWLNKNLVFPKLSEWGKLTKFNTDIVIVFLPSKLTLELIKLLQPKLVVYYCLADFYALSGNPQQTKSVETELVNVSDVLFVQTKNFLSNWPKHENSYVVPICAKVDNFDINASPSPELNNLKRPIIGHVGGIQSHTDLELIKYIALNCEGTFVQVGPAQTNINSLKKIPNFKFLDTQPYDKLSNFMKCFDVGLILYKLNEYSKTVYPAKMNEYLAMGLPVVSTPLPEVVEFSKKYGVINIAKNKEDFVKTIKEVILKDSEEKKQKRIEVAKQNDWTNKIQEISQIIQKTYENKKPENKWNQLVKKYHKEKFKLFILTITSLLLFFSIFYTPLMWTIASPLTINDSLQPSDAIIVFGGGLGERVNSDESFREKLAHAIELYELGNAENILFSSNYQYYFSEAEIMKNLAVSAGIPEKNIILDKTGTSTYENIQSIKKIAEKNNWSRIIIVSSSYHIKRAVSTMKKLSPETEVLASPAKTRFYQKPSKGIKLEQIKGILYEYAALGYYWWKGYV